MAAGGQQLHHGADLDGAEADRALGRAGALAAVPDQPVVHESGEPRRRGAQRQELILRAIASSRRRGRRARCQGDEPVVRGGLGSPVREMPVQRDEGEGGGRRRRDGAEEEEAVR